MQEDRIKTRYIPHNSNSNSDSIWKKISLSAIVNAEYHRPRVTVSVFLDRITMDREKSLCYGCSIE